MAIPIHKQKDPKTDVKEPGTMVKGDPMHSSHKNASGHTDHKKPDVAMPKKMPGCKDC